MQNTTTAGVVRTAEPELLGHPVGLYICFATELWERFSFYGMKYLLLLYLTKYHLFSDVQGLNVLGAYAGLVYALPAIGGLVADRYLGMRKAVLFGGILLSLGHILMAVEGHQAVNYAIGDILTHDLTLASGAVLAAGTTLTEAVTFRDTGALNVFYLALALIVAGVGFLKPNISTIVGKLYPENDARRDSGFTIFYMGINIGSFVATLLCGWLGETYGWRYGFGAAGIGMIIGLIVFTWGQKFLFHHAEPSDPEKLAQRVFGPITVERLIYLLTLPVIAFCWYLVQHEHVVLLTQYSLISLTVVGLLGYGMLYKSADSAKQNVHLAGGIVCTLGIVAALFGTGVVDVGSTPAEATGIAALIALVGFIAYGFIRHNSDEYSRMVVMVILILSTIVFWALFEQSAGSMTLYADRVVDRSLSGGGEIRASQFGSLNAGFIMLLAIPFAMLWTFLDRHKLNPSTPVKFALGIIQAGLGFGVLVYGARHPNEAGQVATVWLVLAYLLHTTGELCLSPVGLSAVTKLSIGRVVGLSMGTWFLATALSELVATRIARLAAIDTSVAEQADIAGALTTYTELFWFLTKVGVGFGLFMLLISPILTRMMRGVR